MTSEHSEAKRVGMQRVIAYLHEATKIHKTAVAFRGDAPLDPVSRADLPEQLKGAKDLIQHLVEKFDEQTCAGLLSVPEKIRRGIATAERRAKESAEPVEKPHDGKDRSSAAGPAKAGSQPRAKRAPQKGPDPEGVRPVGETEPRVPPGTVRAGE